MPKEGELKLYKNCLGTDLSEWIGDLIDAKRIIRDEFRRIMDVIPHYTNRA